MVRFTEKKRFLHGRIRHISAALGVALVFTFGYALGVTSSRTAAQDGDNANLSQEAQNQFRPLYQIYNLIEQQFIDQVDPTVLINGAASGMVDTLNDEYSGYMTPHEYPILNSSLEGEFEGIGVVITTNPDTDEIEIVGLLDNSPAGAAGLLPGDVFIQVNGQDIAGWNQTEFATQVRGPEGTSVELTIRRDNELLVFNVTRARIVTPTVESNLLENGTIAYIRLNNFTSDARSLLDQAIRDLNVNSRQGLILDVRDNPGGLLSSAVDIGSAFVPHGTVVREIFGDGEEIDYTTNGSYIDITVPIVLLINESSASASEILAGAMRDYDLATLIGETTFGKGTVQTWQPLLNGGGVRLTIARWLTPNGQWIHEEGVAPDIRIDFTPLIYNDPNDPQLDAAIRFLNGEQVEPIIEPTPVATDTPS